MKLIGLFTLLLTGLHLSAQTESPFVNTCFFGEYRVETGFCEYNSKLGVFYRDKPVALFCNGEGGGYSFVDTINLNNDDQPDFVCSHHQEDAWFYIVLLVSQKAGYRFVDIGAEYMSVEVYGNLQNEDEQFLRDFRIKDVNGDGRQDIVLNVLEKDGKMIPVKDFTDTRRHNDLVKAISGKKG